MLVIRFIMALIVAPFILCGLVASTLTLLGIGVLTMQIGVAVMAIKYTWKGILLDVKSVVLTGGRVVGD